MSRAGSRGQAADRRDASCATRDGSCAARDAGFTLLELLAVIVLLALVAGAVLVRPPASRANAEMAALTSAIVSELRNVRADAMTAGAPRTVLFDTGNFKVVSEQRGRTIEIQPGIRLLATAAATERRSVSQLGIRFFANGSSTGGALRLERGTQIHEVRINWLSGRVSVVVL